MVKHLEANMCPKGTRVWPAQSQSWLDACIECGEMGDIVVKRSKTDYIIMMEEAWDRLHALEEAGITISGGHLMEELAFIIGFYEVRTELGSILCRSDKDWKRKGKTNALSSLGLACGIQYRHSILFFYMLGKGIYCTMESRITPS